MRKYHVRHCLRWIVLLVVIWAVGVLAVEPSQRVSPCQVGESGKQAEEHEESSSSSSQMQQGTLWPQLIIAEANEVLRQQIGQAMEQAARSLGLTLNTSDLVYICRDDIIIVNTGVAGFEDAESSTRVSQVDVGLIYFSREVDVRFGDGKIGSRLPGFYAVRATMNPSRSTHDPGITLLELLGSSNTTTLTFPITLLPPAAERKLTASLDLDADEGESVACFGWSGPRFTIKVCVAFKPAE